MASGAPVVQILRIMPPAANYATPDQRAGGSTPAEAIDVWAFDAATDQFLDYLCRLQGYAGGGLTFTVAGMAASATSNVARMGIAIHALVDDADDVDVSHTYDFNEVDITAASASGEVTYDPITFTHGADMDSWADGELAIVRVTRNADHANDTMVGAFQLVSLSGKET